MRTSPLSGFSNTTLDGLVIEAGVLMVGTPKVPFGITEGGIKFDPGEKRKTVDYDGKRSEIQGLERIIGWDPILSCTFKELGAPGEGDQITKLLPGSSSASSGHQSSPMGRIKTVTPKTAGLLFSAGDYLTDLYGVWELGGGGVYQYVSVHFPIGICTKYDLMGQPNNEGKITAEFRARLSPSDAAATPGKCPFAIEYHEKLPS